MADGVSASVLELLGWVSKREPTYHEAMGTWKTHCPRLSAWEDALGAGLVSVVRDGDATGSNVTLTDAGRAALDTGR